MRDYCNYQTGTQAQARMFLAHWVMGSLQPGPDTALNYLTQLIPITTLQDCYYCYSHLIEEEETEADV